MDGDFQDGGAPLSPAEAGRLEHELEKRGLATRLRICDRDALGDRQAVQVAAEDLAAALAARAELLPAGKAPPPPLASRSHRLRNGLIAAVLGLVGTMRVVRLVRLPAGRTTAVVVLGIAAALFAAAFGFTKEP